MRRVHSGPLTGLACLVGLLAALTVTVGLGPTGWVVGLACGATTSAALSLGLAHDREHVLGTADRVTLTRAVLSCAVAALAAESLASPGRGIVAALVTLSTIALVLDGVDGRVARRTATVSSFGARFDMEVDAFLIVVLSVYVARTTAWWVLAIGAARYLLVAARWLLPRLRGTVPPRRWCKVVAAVQGVVLAVVAAGVLPGAVAQALLAIALVLLAESFGRETGQLWRSTASTRPEPARRRELPELVGVRAAVDG